MQKIGISLFCHPHLYHHPHRYFWFWMWKFRVLEQSIWCFNFIAKRGKFALVEIECHANSVDIEITFNFCRFQRKWSCFHNAKRLAFLETTVCCKYRILMRGFFEVYLLFRSLNECLLTNFSKMEDVKARGLIKASLLFGKLYVASGSSFFWWAAQSLLLSSQEHCLKGNIWKENKHWWIRQKYKKKR